MTSRRIGASRVSLARCALVALAVAVVAAPAVAQRPGRPAVEVWKSPTCGCCQDWVRLMEQTGFRVKVNDTGNTAIRKRLGIVPRLGSCHTALVGGYAIEGHVPPADVERLLAQRPDAIGLAVPGMPIGSPGMDGPEYGGRRDPYDVLLVARDSGSSVFASHR
jgi:hypothetical protein